MSDSTANPPANPPANPTANPPGESSFRVDLPLYRGPIDLLLYLVRKNELDLAHLSLAKIVDQYVEYLDFLQGLDLTDVGDFLDLASTLIEIKSQAVLPKIVDPDDEEDNIDDPEDELVERLLQYKEIRDAATVLDEMGQRWQTKYQRMSDDLPSQRVDLGDQPIVDLEIWDLVSAFGRIMREAGGPPETEVIYDDTPIHVYMQAIHERLQGNEKVALVELIEGGVHKSALIGWFLATLELSRHHGAAVQQDQFGDIVVVRTSDYSDSLSVNEVDNYGGDDIKAAGLPGGR